MSTNIWVNIGSAKGLMPEGTKSFIIWTYIDFRISEVLWHWLESDFAVSVQATILYTGIHSKIVLLKLINYYCSSKEPINYLMKLWGLIDAA